jgi:hypothetical protein
VVTFGGNADGEPIGGRTLFGDVRQSVDGRQHPCPG